MRAERMLASDLDGTLIDATGTDEGAMESFRDFVAEAKDLVLAYVTGRSFEHAVEGIAAAGLPWPDHLGTSVGTELRMNAGSRAHPRWEIDPRFRAMLQGRLGSRPLAEADPIVLAHEGTRQQPVASSHVFKRSFFVGTEVDVRALTRILERELEAAGFVGSLMSSVDPGTGEGLLDLLPHGVTKATAIEFLGERLRLDAQDIVFAGDSGNDLAALRGPWHGIVVGNASDALRAELHGRPRVVMAKEHVLRGVLEGLTELGWIDARTQ